MNAKGSAGAFFGLTIVVAGLAAGVAAGAGAAADFPAVAFFVAAFFGFFAGAAALAAESSALSLPDVPDAVVFFAAVRFFVAFF